MTKSNTHAILADLHKLLSSYSTEDFLDASNYGDLPSAMREALRALAHEADSAITNGSQRKPRTPAIPLKAAHEKAENPPDKLVELIRSSPYFNNTAALVTYAKNIGLNLNLRPKESREKLAKRLATLINELPKAERKRAITELSGKNNQTQGWIDVIKSRNQ